MHSDKYIKTEIKIYNNKIDTNFDGNKIPRDNEFCTWLSVMLLDSVVEIDNDHYPQIFLKECKYAAKKKKIINSINEELDLDESDSESDDDESNKSDKD